MERLLNGAPVLNTHSQWDLRSVIGVVESAEVRNGKAYAKVRLSSTENNKDMVENIKSGIFRNISVGYKIHKIEETRFEDVENSLVDKEVRVIDWEPLEISFVPIPADAGAQVRGEKDVYYDCEVIKKTDKKTVLTEGKRMEPKTKVEPIVEPKKKAEPTVPIIDDEGIRQAAIERTAFIYEICERHSVEKTKRDEYIKSKKTEREIGLEVLRAEEDAQNKKAQLNKTVSVSVGNENQQMRFRSYERNVLRLALGSKKIESKPEDNEYKVPSILGLARIYLQNEHNVRDAYTLTPKELVKRALHTGGDFAQIVENIADKALMMGYMEMPYTYEYFISERSVSDFKEVSSTRVSVGGDLPKVEDGAEFPYTSATADGEKYSVDTFGQIIGLTEQLLVNDDVGAFTRLPEMLGLKAKRTENSFFWGLLTGNQVMADSVALFHATHKNLATSAGAPNTARLAHGRAAMRLQKDPDDKKRLNISPKYLIVPAALETTAQKLVTQVVPRNVDDVNPFAGNLMVVTEALLDDNSSDAWYLAGSLDQGPIAERALIDGMGPKITIKDSFETNSMKTKVSHQFGMRVIDFRQLYKNAGA